MRYFRQDDLDKAQDIAGALESAGVEVAPRFVEGYEDDGVRPLHFELWFEDQT